MKYHHILKTYRSELILAGIVIITGFLYLYNLGKNGWGNPYYAAAVRSILENPSEMIWGSFDQAGFVTVDKPPVALWIQTTGALVFGYTGWALILPQALAGIGSVLLLYLVISRSFGKPAGLISALVMTITPVAIAVGRTNNLDGLLVFILLLAFITAIEAWRRGSLFLLAGTAILIGIGFNIKMIEAFAVVPAFFGMYLLSKPIPLKVRITHLACAGIVLLVVSFSWAVMVDLTPADQRPYIGSSDHNSALELIFGYNGLSRIIGNGGSSRDGPGGMNQTMVPPGLNNIPDGAQHPSTFPGLNQSSMQDHTPPGWENGSSRQEHHPGTNPSPGKGRMDEAGTPGLFRLGNESIAGQISWLLPLAIFGLLAWFRRPSLTMLRDLTEQEILSGALLLWLIPELVYFSFSSGHFHLYYLVMVAPPLAALVAIGIMNMYREYQGNSIRGWILVTAIPVTGIFQALILRYTSEFAGLLPWVILLFSLCTGGILAGIRIRKNKPRVQVQKGIICLGLGLLLIAPAVWSFTPLVFGSNGSIPTAGPDQMSGKGGPGMPGMGDTNTDYSGLISYLESHRGDATYLVGVSSSNGGGSDLIIRTGQAVMAIGGFAGSDPILTGAALREMVRQGDIRYFYLSQQGGMPGNSGNTTSWISDSCSVVPEDEWNANSTADTRSRQGRILYDCSGV